MIILIVMQLIQDQENEIDEAAKGDKLKKYWITTWDSVDSK